MKVEMQNPNCMVMVDNCYDRLLPEGEIVDKARGRTTHPIARD